jgi:pimeloyl-ACP methyl ester carboxylesterase
LALVACSTPDHAVQGPDLPPAAAKSKTIVLIHGMFLTPASWAEWKSYFEAAGYKVYAPAWPLHDAAPEKLRAAHPNPKLGALELEDVLNSYRTFLKTLPEKPILIGHSMGGLITQILLQEHLGVAGVAIDSAPPKGLISLKLSFLRANWAVISPFADEGEPYLPDQDSFRYAFSDCVPEKVSDRAYQAFAVPESRHVGNGPTTELAEIAFEKKSAPLLLIAGEDDNIIPASLNYSNFQRYEDAPSLTEFKMFPGRCHYIFGQNGWQEVAGYVKTWLAAH